MTAGKKFDGGKLRYDLIPPEVLEALATILTFGAQKYGENNWQELEDFEDRYTAALFRHIQDRRMGERIDPESGCLHWAHALCNTAFLLWGDIQDCKEADRLNKLNDIELK